MIMIFLHNHLGYQLQAPKKILLQHRDADFKGVVSLISAQNRQVIFQAPLVPLGAVDGWQKSFYSEVDFSSIQQTGDYFFCLENTYPPVVSATFSIRADLYDGQLISDLVHYLKSQRCGGKFDRADHARPKYPPTEHTDLVDVHGGWYDASGDASKYLSHLSYANFMNPQQTPQVVWNLIDAYARMPKASVWLEDKIYDEALHGADFLMRMLDSEGYFYMTVFDRWSKDVAQRDICSYATQQGHKFATFQAGFRQGAGSAIAALARVSTLDHHGEFHQQDYLQAAVKAFAHLKDKSLAYLDDGEENIIDDYCALLAACELAHATQDQQYIADAEYRIKQILNKQAEEGWFWANTSKNRSYFHAAEAGLLYIALMRFMEVSQHNSLVPACKRALFKALTHDIAITFHLAVNPFAYPRQVVQMPDQARSTQFFIPHQNESGYWWQGENARLASLASAAQMGAAIFKDDDQLNRALTTYAQASLDWIFGCNPFDVCMMQGVGHNNPRYEKGFWNAPGGVCNGITSGLEDERDIDFKAPGETVPTQSWRWTEQWLPHGAWLLHALSHQVDRHLPSSKT